MIINHEHPLYRKRIAGAGLNAYNGAYYYSIEICKHFVPAVQTDRNWITINIPGCGANHSIVFIHNNLHPENYSWLKNYHDLILVCGIPETVLKMEHLGTAIYLPLSIDVAEVSQYIRPKTKGIAYVGRPAKRANVIFEADTDFLEGLPRPKLLAAMAEYQSVFAVGRTALEAKVLGCEILPYDERFPDTERWQVLDSREAAKLLDEKIKLIDC